MIRMAVFDMVGTTVSGNDAVARAFIDAFMSKGLALPRETVDPLMEYKTPAAIKMALTAMGASASQPDIIDIHDRFVDIMLDYYEYSPEVEPLPGVEETLSELKEEGLVITLNTGLSREIADAIMDRLQWQEMQLVDDYIASDQVSNGRPDPEMIRTLMRRSGIYDPRCVIKIGDTGADIDEGKNAGCFYSIGITTGAFSSRELELHHPDFIIDNLSELSALIHQHA